MELIDKAAVVAEIEKRLDELWDLLPNASDVVKDNYTKEEANITGKYTALESFSKFLDTLEVKEVNISSIESYIKEEWNKINTGHTYSIIDSYNIFLGICIYFYELGQAQKGE